MTEDTSTGRIAVIGMGPRGLGALEALTACWGETRAPLRVDVFDPFDAPGAGPNFAPGESPLCRLNIPMRDLDIRPPASSAAGRFAEWWEGAGDVDAFPPRADLGRYLEARYADLRAMTALQVRGLDTPVDEVQPQGGAWRLRTGDTWHGPYAEVLLVIGQPEVEPDEQLAGWKDHVRDGKAALASAYPAHVLQDRAAAWAGRTVAVRGLALSAFDVLRVLTVGQGGRFEAGGYVKSGREPGRILPFSLDGKPPSPKPETDALDARFDPAPGETEAFEEAVSKAARGDPDSARRHIDAALVPAVTRILRETGGGGDGGDADGVADWLCREWDAPGSQEDETPIGALRTGIAMAEGEMPPSIGYAVGQIWRKWQDGLRKGFNPAHVRFDTAAVVIGFDEGLKRYSYGPPISSSRELAALIDAGLVDLGWAADPGIEMIEGGWELTAGGAAARASVMVDAVLPSPDLGAVRDPLIRGLVSDGRLVTCGEGLAAHTAEDGTLIGADGVVSAGLCLLGRLALGSVIAVDSLHDCFGDASKRWAQGVERRIADVDQGQRPAVPNAVPQDV